MIKKLFLDINDLLNRFQFIKFILAGSIATSVDLVVLFFLTEILGIWYLLSAVFSFLTGFVVSFFLQKFWTFRNRVTASFYKQVLNYLFVMGISLIIGLNFLYILVDRFAIHYLIAQVVVDGILAVGRFFINRYIIFKN